MPKTRTVQLAVGGASLHDRDMLRRLKLRKGGAAAIILGTLGGALRYLVPSLDWERVKLV